MGDGGLGYQNGQAVREYSHRSRTATQTFNQRAVTRKMKYGSNEGRWWSVLGRQAPGAARVVGSWPLGSGRMPL